MTLKGKDYEKLRDLVISAFDRQSLEELVRFELDRDLGHDVAENRAHAAVVYEFIGKLYQEGLLTRFLQAVLRARPNREDLQAEIPRIWPEAGQAAPIVPEKKAGALATPPKPEPGGAGAIRVTTAHASRVALVSQRASIARDARGGGPGQRWPFDVTRSWSEHRRGWSLADRGIPKEDLGNERAMRARVDRGKAGLSV